MSDSQDVTINQEVVKEWLTTKHCTLWQQWDIVSNDGLESASKWMIEQLSDIALFAQNNQKDLAK